MNKVVAFVCALSISAVGAGLGSLSTKAIHAEGGITKVLSPVGIMRTAKDTVVVTGCKTTQFLSGDTIVMFGSFTEHDDFGRPLEYHSEMDFLGDSIFGRTEYHYSDDGKTVTTTSYLKEGSDGDWYPQARAEMELFDASHFQTGMLYREMAYHTWNNGSNDWVLQSRTRTEWTGGTIDHPELITETTLDTVTGNWVESGRMYPVYNSEGSLSTFSIEYIDDLTGAWLEFMRYTYSYNEEGRLEKEEMELRMDRSSEMEHFTTTEFTYETISLTAHRSLRHSVDAQTAPHRAPMYDLRGRRIESFPKVEISGEPARLIRVSRDRTRSWKRMPALDR